MNDVTVTDVAHARASATTVNQTGGADFDTVNADAAQTTITYKVVKGDTLGAIAKRYNVKLSELRAWNGLKGDQIKLGQTLRIHNK